MISHVRAIAPQPKLMVQLSRSGISWAPTTLPLKISAFTFQIAIFLNFNLSNCWLYHPSKPTVTMSPKDFFCPKALLILSTQSKRPTISQIHDSMTDMPHIETSWNFPSSSTFATHPNFQGLLICCHHIGRSFG